MDDSTDELIAQICHELRAPLTPIKGYLHTLLRRDEELEVTSSAVDWPTIVADQVDLYRQSDLTRELTVEVDPRVGGVLADANLATGVLANLLTNALRHSPAGTPIAVTVSLDGPRVVTSVSDRGPGVPAEHHERIFDRFAQVRESRAASAGVGLGLYLARRSLDAMGGEIWCTDAPGGGAELTFTLPVATPP
jgi:signal transduction histidine kinase